MGHLAVAAAAAAWGTIPPIVQGTTAHVLVLVALRMGFAALALGPPIAATGSLRVPSGWRLRLTLQGLALVGNWVFFFGALKLLPGATAVLIGYVFPLAVALLAPVTLGEVRERHVPALAVAGFAGLAVLLWPEIGAGRIAGAALAMGGAATSVYLVLMAKRLVTAIDGPVIVFWENLLGVVVLLPFAFVLSSGDVPWVRGAVIGVVHTALATVVFFRGFARIPAQEAGVLMYVEPVTAVVLAGVVGVRTWIGGAIVLAAGVALVVRSPVRTASARAG